MKRICLTILIFLLSGLLLSTFCQPTFQRLYGTLDDEIGLSILQCSSGGYLVSATTKNFYYGDDETYLLRLTENGDTLWTRVPQNPVIWDWSANILERANQTYIVVDECDSYTGCLTIHNFDDNGNDLWMKNYLLNDFTEVHSVINAPDEGIVIGGTFGWYQPKMFILRTDNSGNQIWMKSYGGAYDEDYAGTGVIRTQDDGYLMCGYKTLPGGFGDQYGILIKTDTGGSAVWIKSYQSTLSGNRLFLDVEQDSDGSYIVTGCDVTGFVEYIYHPFLMKILQNGQVNWTNYFNDGMIFQTLTHADSGNYFLTGVRDDTAFVVKADPGGNETWSKVITSQYENSYFYKMIPTVEGNFLITGRAGSNLGYGGSDVLVIKTDENGIITRTGDYKPLPDNGNLQVQPNPCSEKITIRCMNPVLSVSIFNTQGNCLCNFQVKPGLQDEPIVLSTDGFPPGLLNVKCETSRGVYLKKVIKL